MRQTTYEIGSTVPDYDKGWDALMMRVKSLNKFGLDIDGNFVELTVFLIVKIFPCWS